MLQVSADVSRCVRVQQSTALGKSNSRNVSIYLVETASNSPQNLKKKGREGNVERMCNFRTASPFCGSTKILDLPAAELSLFYLPWVSLRSNTSSTGCNMLFVVTCTVKALSSSSGISSSGPVWWSLSGLSWALGSRGSSAVLSELPGNKLHLLRRIANAAMA